MKGFQTAPDQIDIFYNPGDTTQEKAVAHAKGTGKEVMATPYADAPTAYNVWTRIWEGLPADRMHIFDESDERYEALIAGRDYGFEAWRKICTHNPDLIKSAIAISGEEVVLLNRQTEVYRLQELGPEGADQKVPDGDHVAPENRADNEVDGLGTMLQR